MVNNFFFASRGLPSRIVYDTVNQELRSENNFFCRLSKERISEQISTWKNADKENLHFHLAVSGIITVKKNSDGIFEQEEKFVLHKGEIEEEYQDMVEKILAKLVHCTDSDEEQKLDIEHIAREFKEDLDTILTHQEIAETLALSLTEIKQELAAIETNISIDKSPSFEALTQLLTSVKKSFKVRSYPPLLSTAENKEISLPALLEKLETWLHKTPKIKISTGSSFSSDNFSLQQYYHELPKYISVQRDALFDTEFQNLPYIAILEEPFLKYQKELQDIFNNLGKFTRTQNELLMDFPAGSSREIQHIINVTTRIPTYFKALKDELGILGDRLNTIKKNRASKERINSVHKNFPWIDAEIKSIIKSVSELLVLIKKTEKFQHSKREKNLNINLTPHKKQLHTLYNVLKILERQINLIPQSWEYALPDGEVRSALKSLGIQQAIHPSLEKTVDFMLTSPLALFIKSQWPQRLVNEKISEGTITLYPQLHKLSKLLSIYYQNWIKIDCDHRLLMLAHIKYQSSQCLEQEDIPAEIRKEILISLLEKINEEYNYQLLRAFHHKKDIATYNKGCKTQHKIHVNLSPEYLNLNPAVETHFKPQTIGPSVLPSIGLYSGPQN